MSDRWAGVAYEWGDTLRSFITPKEDRDVLRSAVINILLTRKGERVMMPTFGSNVPDAVFEQNDDVLVAVLRASVQAAIEEWDDRIRFLDFEYERRNNSLILKIQYQNILDPKATEQFMEIELTPSMLTTLGT